MDQEAHEHSLITWVVAVGIVLVVVFAVSGYIIANPESLYRVFGGKQPAAAVPVTAVNGTAAAAQHEPAPHTKHYANIFFEFDYPENFVITDELVNATRDTAGTTEVFGSAHVTLSATGTDGVYRIHVTSRVGAQHKSVAQKVSEAKQEFFIRPDRGPNDSYQDITVTGKQAYKNFTSGYISIGIPTDNLNYSAEIDWDPQTGARGTANSYLGILEDSFIEK